MPENTFECPFLEEDCKTNEVYCYLKSASGEFGHCVSLCVKGCPIIPLVKGGILKSYHVIKIDGSVGKCYLVVDENSIPVQQFYHEIVAEKVCDELNMRELLKEEKEEVF